MPAYRFYKLVGEVEKKVAERHHKFAEKAEYCKKLCAEKGWVDIGLSPLGANSVIIEQISDSPLWEKDKIFFTKDNGKKFYIHYISKKTKEGRKLWNDLNKGLPPVGLYKIGLPTTFNSSGMELTPPFYLYDRTDNVFYAGVSKDIDESAWNIYGCPELSLEELRAITDENDVVNGYY